MSENLNGNIGLKVAYGKCNFCGSKKINDVKYGPMYSLGDVTAHYFCVLLSNNIYQKGADNEGILGFLLPDIKSELIRSKNVLCAYCHKGHATLTCCSKVCTTVYHYPCGYKNGALFQFFEFFKNYCSKHRIRQTIPKLLLPNLKESNLVCSICYNEINFEGSIATNVKVLWAPCCKKSWFHRLCVQKLACSAGYLFKCPICNDKEIFRDWMLRYGVYIPDKDASWELEPNAYEDLLLKHDRCDARECKCPEGRQKDIEDTMWEIVLCQTCGSQGIHIACGKLKFSDPEWNCQLCKDIINRRNDRLSDNVENVNKSSHDEIIPATPGSSKPIFKVSSPATLRKKRKRRKEKLGKRKRSKNESSDILRDEIPNNQTIVPLSEIGRTDFTKVSPSPGTSPKAGAVVIEDSDTDSDSLIDVVSNSPRREDAKEKEEIIISSSSDSECEIVEVVDNSDDDVKMIKETKKCLTKSASPPEKSHSSPEKELNFDGPLGYGRYLFQVIRYVTPLRSYYSCEYGVGGCSK